MNGSMVIPRCCVCRRLSLPHRTRRSCPRCCRARPRRWPGRGVGRGEQSLAPEPPGSASAEAAGSRRADTTFSQRVASTRGARDPDAAPGGGRALTSPRGRRRVRAVPVDARDAAAASPGFDSAGRRRPGRKFSAASGVG